MTIWQVILMIITLPITIPLALIMIPIVALYLIVMMIYW